MMILVTGGTGTVGRHLVRELLAREAKVWVASRDSAKVRAVLGPEVASIPLDYEDPASVQRAFEGKTKVFLLTPGSSENDHELAIRAIDLAREAGVEHIVRLSVLGADAQPTYGLGRQHRQVELYLLASGIAGTVLRPNHFMENLINYQGATIKAEAKIYMPLGQAKISFIAARDIAAVAAEALLVEGYENQSYDLTGPEALTMGQVAEALTRALGRPVEYVDIDEQTLRQSMAGAPEWAVQGVLELHEADRSGMMGVVTHTVQEITGRPAQDINSWANEHAAEFA